MNKRNGLEVLEIPCEWLGERAGEGMGAIEVSLDGNGRVLVSAGGGAGGAGRMQELKVVEVESDGVRLATCDLVCPGEDDVVVKVSAEVAEQIGAEGLKEGV